MKPNEIPSGGVLDPSLDDPRLLRKTPPQSWILDPARTNFIPFHFDEQSLLKGRFWGVPRMKPNETE